VNVHRPSGQRQHLPISTGDTRGPTHELKSDPTFTAASAEKAQQHPWTRRSHPEVIVMAPELPMAISYPV
jgi:hypothetical protein